MPAFRSSEKRVFLAFSLSLALHALALFPPLLEGARRPAPRPALEARLLPPAMHQAVPEPVLKDTLAEDEKEAHKAIPLPKLGSGGGKAVRLSKDREESALRKLSSHVYYPEEAVRLGLEGEVRLLVVLDATGRVVRAEVAAGSGHAILDQAAREAALAIGRLPDAGVRQFILPVVFRLQ